MEQLQSFLPFLLMFVVIYFFMIRPQQKRAKNEKEFESSLKVGDKIVKLNSTNSKYLNIQFITNLFQSEDGKQISISVERQGKILEFKFRLEKLL